MEQEHAIGTLMRKLAFIVAYFATDCELFKGKFPARVI